MATRRSTGRRYIGALTAGSSQRGGVTRRRLSRCTSHDGFEDSSPCRFDEPRSCYSGWATAPCGTGLLDLRAIGGNAAKTLSRGDRPGGGSSTSRSAWCWVTTYPYVKCRSQESHAAFHTGSLDQGAGLGGAARGDPAGPPQVVARFEHEGGDLGARSVDENDGPDVNGHHVVPEGCGRSMCHHTYGVGARGRGAGLPVAAHTPSVVPGSASTSARCVPGRLEMHRDRTASVTEA